MRIHAWLLLGVVAACGTSRVEVLGPGGSAGVTGDDGGAAAVIDGGSSADYCSGSGPPVIVGDHNGGSVSACTGGIAQAAFRYALCTCEGLVSATRLATDSFDDADGPYGTVAPGAGGGVGTNGSLDAQGTLAVGGSLWASDSTGITADHATVLGELHAAGRVASGTLLSVSADAFVVGDVAVTGDLRIGGTLHQPPGHTATGGTSSIAATVTGPVSVGPACDCDPALLLDVATYVESYRAHNDDAALGVDPRALENVTSDLTMTLPCGRVFFTRVGGSAAIRLVLPPGRTAIFVGGDLAPNGAFTVDVGASSELDLFVEGNVVVGKDLTLGSAAAPSRARLYVGGSGTVNLQNAATIAGNVYAPRAELVLGSQATTVFGSIFARRVSVQGSLAIHFDEGVLRAGASCPSAPSTCTSCHDCGNQACVAGTCGSCTDSSECCAPLLCVAGRCVAEIK